MVPPGDRIEIGVPGFLPARYYDCIGALQGDANVWMPSNRLAA